MPFQITGERLTSLFRRGSVALAGAYDLEALDAAVTWKGAAR